MDEADMGYAEEKAKFAQALKAFAATLAKEITQNNEWTIRGFIDIFKNVYTVSADTKVVSKILELHLFPHFLSFAERIGYRIELASHQNWYPDLTFIAKSNADVKFAVDLKTTYRDEAHPGFHIGLSWEVFCGQNQQKEHTISLWPVQWAFLRGRYLFAGGSAVGRGTSLVFCR